MLSVLIQNHLPDLRTELIAAVAVVGIVAVIVIVIISRRRRAERELEEMEFLAGERRNRFFAAADSLPFSSDPGDTAQAIAAVFKDYLSVRVLALFAGPEGGKQLENLLLRDQDVTDRGALLPRLLPTRISSDVLDTYGQPQFVPLGQFALGPESNPSAAIDADISVPAEEGQEVDSDVDLANTLAVKSRESAAASIHRSDSVAVLPWKGPFGWQGLIVAGSEGEMDPNDLSVVYEFQVPISSRLSCALELDQRKAHIADAREQQSRTVRFVRSLPSLLPIESHLHQILHGVTELLNADSAAYWRVDQQSRTLNMIAADNLNTNDFLPVPIGRGFCGEVVESVKVVAIADALSDPRCLFPEQYREAGIGSYLGVPVFTGNDVTGVLEVHTTRPHKYDEGNSAALKIAAASIQARTSTGTTGALGLRAETAYIALSEALQGLGSRKELLEAAVEVVGHAVGASRTLILQPEEVNHGAPADYMAKYEYCADQVLPALHRRFAAGALTRAVGTAADNKPVVIDDSTRDSLMEADVAADLQVLSEVAAPIKASTESPWLLWVHRCDFQRPWSRDEVAFVERVAHQIAIARANIEALEKASGQVESAVAAAKSANQAANQANQAAKQADQAAKQAKGLIDSLPEAVIELDAKGHISFFNTLGRNYLGLRDEDKGREAEKVDALRLSDDLVWDQINASLSVRRFETYIVASAIGAVAGTAPSKGTEARRPVTILASPVRADGGDITARIVVIAPREEPAPQKPGLEQQMAEIAEQARAKEVTLSARIAALEGSLAQERATSEKLSADATDRLTPEQSEALRSDHERATKAAQQLLDVNRLKSEFIVNAGRELDASLQSMLGQTELLGDGSYGTLSGEQLEAVKAIYAWGRRLKNDVDWLIDYGSARSRRLDSAEEAVPEGVPGEAVAEEDVPQEPASEQSGMNEEKK